MSEGLPPSTAATMSNSGSHTHTGASSGNNDFTVPAGDREELLLDDLRVEIRRLTDAVENQNEQLERLLDALDDDAGGTVIPIDESGSAGAEPRGERR